MALGQFTALVGGALTVLGLVSWPASAEAKSYPVRIESQPSGATVYLDSKEGDPLGQTPYTGKLPSGAHTLIIELEGYVSQVQDISIRRKRRTQRIAVKLSKIELATIDIVPDRDAGVRTSDIKGARILVDGKDMGTLPDTIKVPAGPHQVEVVKDGYKTFETWVEAAEGETLTVSAALVAVGAGKRRPRSEVADQDAPEELDPPRRAAAREEAALGDEPEGSVDQAAAASGRQVPYVAVAAGFELGGRRFRPNAQEVQGLREYDAGGVPMVRISADLNPLAFSTNPWISGWGVYGTYVRAMPLDSTARLMDLTEVDVPTVWSEFDVGLRFRYRFAPQSFVGVQGGYGSHAFTFDFANQAAELEGQVPEVEYTFWRIGAEGRFGFGRLAALGFGGTRLVRSIGDLGERFAQTDILAFDAGLGLAATVTSSIEARLVGRYDHYAHEYTAMPSGPGTAATSGLDQFFGATLSAVFVY